jgi:hypothetical protein
MAVGAVLNSAHIRENFRQVLSKGKQKMKKLLTAAALLASVCSAQASRITAMDRHLAAMDRACYGIVHVDKKWTSVVHADVDYWERRRAAGDKSLGAIARAVDPETPRLPPPLVVCRFRTASKLGQRILAICPDGTLECQIDVLRSRLSTKKPIQTTITAIKKVTNND